MPKGDIVLNQTFCGSIVDAQKWQRKYIWQQQSLQKHTSLTWITWSSFHKFARFWWLSFHLFFFLTTISKKAQFSITEMCLKLSYRKRSTIISAEQCCSILMQASPKCRLEKAMQENRELTGLRDGNTQQTWQKSLVEKKENT